MIYHNGVWVNALYPYSILKPANVLGTQEILRLASLIQTKPVHHISTLSVFSDSAYAEETQIFESDPLDRCEDLEVGYSQSKWVAEKLVMQARDRGLLVCIYRLARVTGHTQTGICNTDDLFCRIIKGCIQVEMTPNMEAMVDNLTPVDFVSRAIVHLSLSHRRPSDEAPYRDRPCQFLRPTIKSAIAINGIARSPKSINSAFAASIN